MIYLTPTGQDLLFDEKRLETGKFFANKVWNAARLVTHAARRRGPRRRCEESQLELTLADRWILSRFANAVKDTTRFLKTYRLQRGGERALPLRLERLLRLVPRDGEAALGRGRRPAPTGARRAGWRGRCSTGSSACCIPFMPFVTEEIWQALPHDGETLATAAWPQRQAAPGSTPRPSAQVAFLQELVVAVRNLRVEIGLPPGRARAGGGARHRRAARPGRDASRRRSSRSRGSRR